MGLFKFTFGATLSASCHFLLEMLNVKYRFVSWRGAISGAAGLGILLAAGCGWIADKDRIVIATLEGKNITRGDLDKVIRNMPPDERPPIRTKGDVRKTLANYLDAQVKSKNAKRLQGEGKIHVPRELCEAVYRANHPEAFIEMSNPEDYNLTERDVQYMKEEREIRIDELCERILAEVGIEHLVSQAQEDGSIEITDAEYQNEYEIRKGTLHHPERVTFSGVLIPGASEDVRSAGAEARLKLAQRMPAAEVAKQYKSLGAQVLESELENDPRKFKFAGFWQQASGAEIGAVIGPIFIQDWQAAEEDVQGSQARSLLPSGVLVCVIQDRVDETPKTLEEAKPDLEYNILYAKVMERLRQESGVKIFDDKLPDDPTFYDPDTALTSLPR
ncbi:MAG: hypothetical protein AMXMBFR4_16450 [Candidatus Hydrogenedentota bacterium]